MMFGKKIVVLMLLVVSIKMNAHDIKNWQDFRRQKIAYGLHNSPQLNQSRQQNDSRWQLLQYYPKISMVYVAIYLLARRG